MTHALPLHRHQRRWQQRTRWRRCVPAVRSSIAGATALAAAVLAMATLGTVVLAQCDASSNTTQDEGCENIGNTTTASGFFYRVMESGFCGGPSEFQPVTAEWLDVVNKEACEAAAESFGTLAHGGITGVTEVSSAEFPIGCYYRIGVGVYFNTLGHAQNSTTRVSICYFDINEPAPAPNDPAQGYSLLDFSFDGVRCDAPGYQWVFSLAECNTAALELGLGDTNATEVFAGDYENNVIQRAPVYGCYLDTFSSATGQLFFYKPTTKFNPVDFLDFSTSEKGEWPTSSASGQRTTDCLCGFAPGCTDPAYLEYDPRIVRDDGSCFLNRSFFFSDTGVCPDPVDYPDGFATSPESEWSCEGQQLCTCIDAGQGTCACPEEEGQFGCCDCGCGNCTDLCHDFATTTTTTTTTTTSTTTTTTTPTTTAATTSTSTVTTTTKTTTSTTVVDCEAEWGPWGVCSLPCNWGTRARTFVVTVEPRGANAAQCGDAGTVVVIKCKLEDCESETPFLPLYNWKAVGDNFRLNGGPPPLRRPATVAGALAAAAATAGGLVLARGVPGRWW